jgi:hypothetical protein
MKTYAYSNQYFYCSDGSGMEVGGRPVAGFGRAPELSPSPNTISEGGLCLKINSSQLNSIASGSACILLMARGALSEDGWILICAERAVNRRRGGDAGAGRAGGGRVVGPRRGAARLFPKCSRPTLYAVRRKGQATCRGYSLM